MANEKHPFDVAAEQLEAIADSPTTGQDASVNYWELKFATDESVGDFPQALVSQEYAFEHWSESDGLGTDGFPSIPNGLPVPELQSTAHWTDVLSSSLWSEGYLLNERALAAFKQCSLGNFREYQANIRETTGSQRLYTYAFFRNRIDPTAIDFERSEFYVAEMLGIPKGSIEVNSFDEFVDLRGKASAGELDGIEQFSSVDYRKLHFRHGQTPCVDLFQLNQMGIRVYISNRLRNAIMDSGISGLEIKPNKRLFVHH